MCNMFQKMIKLPHTNRATCSGLAPLRIIQSRWKTNSWKSLSKQKTRLLKWDFNSFNKTRHHVNLQARSFSPRTLRSFLVYFLCNSHAPRFGKPCPFLQFPATVDPSSTSTCIGQITTYRKDSRDKIIWKLTNSVEKKRWKFITWMIQPNTGKIFKIIYKKKIHIRILGITRINYNNYNIMQCRF